MTSRLIAALVVSLAVTAAPAVLVDVSAVAESGPAAAPPTTEPPSGSPATTALDNEFIPEDANIGDCISALPRPDCGSKARGGWRQVLVFVILIAGIAAIGVRLVLGVRKRARQAS